MSIYYKLVALQHLQVKYCKYEMKNDLFYFLIYYIVHAVCVFTSSTCHYNVNIVKYDLKCEITCMYFIFTMLTIYQTMLYVFVLLRYFT